MKFTQFRSLLMPKNLIIFFCIFFSLAGCKTVQNVFSDDGAYSGISPPSLHRVDKDISKHEPLESVSNELNIAEKQPYVDYYSALGKAKLNQDPLTAKADIRDFIDKGIVVVNVSCLRWFKSLAEAEIRFHFAQSNQNVIQDLGTTLLGLGKANPLFVGTYGAGFTAFNGYEKSFSQSFFLAPNSNKVKSHIFSALDKRAAELRAQESFSFSQAYLELERYADICTQQTAKEVINSSLDKTQTTIDKNSGGRVETVVTDAQIAKISYDQALANAQKEVRDKANAEKADLMKQISSLQDENKQLSDQLKRQSEAKTLNPL